MKNHVVEPSDIAVFREEFYVCDFRVSVFSLQLVSVTMELFCELIEAYQMS